MPGYCSDIIVKEEDRPVPDPEVFFYFKLDYGLQFPDFILITR